MIDAMRLKTATALAAALLLVLAGCTGGVSPDAGGDGAATATDGGTETVAEETLQPSNGDGDAGGDAGSVTFYLSDAPIEEFEHLNVTVTKVGLQRAEDGNGSNESGWVEYDVDDRTVDLTELQGPNATSLGVLRAPAGNYSKVFVHVGEVEGILKTGEEVNVKLPSEKLQLNTDFRVSPNSSSSFVFDISVFEAGNSGKHILKPVVSESGTGDDVEIRDVDEEDQAADERDDEEEDEQTETNETDDETAEPTESDDGSDDGGGPPDDDTGDDNRAIRPVVTAGITLGV